ncbi:HNH endonuclease signature motif containing protein [Mycobacterium sp. IDR2000157661]|uniref:HNH endonuclease signature motif containing protein n=1 Tax=Mycobacterium sp. IDR2000157661 TaxID=2867005 RepID=UPI001EEB2246|nr:HNH endonuclease signature motif containing protein [Mycobacterium sp. IDR2000157661]ULE32993.1 HNH endonuclease [Mycobacterium sp. IDR2000157661]
MAIARDSVDAVVARLRAVREQISGLNVDALTPVERLELLGELEVDRRSQPAAEHRLLQALVNQSTAGEMGGANWPHVLTERLRISRAEARRRLAEAADLGPRTALTGEALEPMLPEVAKRQAAGELGAEHVRIIRTFFAELPVGVDLPTRESCEHTLAALAAEHTPEVLAKAAARLAAYVNPDGEFSDRDRAAKRGLSIGPQGADGMSAIRGRLDPEARATLDAVLAKLAAPGMCNPDDEKPCVDGEPDEETVRRDYRSPAQRNHDALTAMGRALLASGRLGEHNGLPVSLIVTTTLQDLEAGIGHGITAGGTMLPMREVIKLASHSYHYLAVFDKHTGQTLYLGRTKRLANRAQRIVLYARHRGCTKPGCPVPAYWTQAHHAAADWIDGGETNVDDLTLACGPDNRLVETGGWTTRIRDDGRTEWIPPPHLDRGQSRVNSYHHPEELLDCDGRTGDDP